MRFIYFIFLLVGGLALMVYREKVQRFTGSIGFAEHYLGAGGTYHLYLLLGLGVIIFSFLYVTGTAEDVFNSTLGRFFFVKQEG